MDRRERNNSQDKNRSVSDNRQTPPRDQRITRRSQNQPVGHFDSSTGNFGTPLYDTTPQLTIPRPNKVRNRTDGRQLEVLENVAAETLKPNRATRIRLGEELGMTPRQVQIWFQNKRAKLKKLNMPIASAKLKREKNDPSRAHHDKKCDFSYGGKWAKEIYKNGEYRDPYEKYFYELQGDHFNPQAALYNSQGEYTEEEKYSNAYNSNAYNIMPFGDDEYYEAYDQQRSHAASYSAMPYAVKPAKYTPIDYNSANYNPNEFNVPTGDILTDPLNIPQHNQMDAQSNAPLDYQTFYPDRDFYEGVFTELEREQQFNAPGYQFDGDQGSMGRQPYYFQDNFIGEYKNEESNDYSE